MSNIIILLAIISLLSIESMAIPDESVYTGNWDCAEGSETIEKVDWTQTFNGEFSCTGEITDVSSITVSIKLNNEAAQDTVVNVNEFHIMGIQGFYVIGQINSGACVGDVFIALGFFQGSEIACCTDYVEQDTLVTKIRISGGACGVENTCSGNLTVTYNPALNNPNYLPDMASECSLIEEY